MTNEQLRERAERKLADHLGYVANTDHELELLLVYLIRQAGWKVQVDERGSEYEIVSPRKGENETTQSTFRSGCGGNGPATCDPKTEGAGGLPMPQ